MKDHWVTIGGALVAFALVVFLFAPPGMVGEGNLSRPTTEDSGSHGLRVAHEWLLNSGVPVRSWRQRHTGLSGDETLAPTGNLMFTTLPLRVAATGEEFELLLEWVKAGNHLIALMARSDHPAWAQNRSHESIDELASTFAFELEVPEQGEKASVDMVDVLTGLTQEAIVLTPRPAYPLLEGVSHVHVRHIPTLDVGTRMKPGHGLALPLLFSPQKLPQKKSPQKETPSAALWELRVHKGRMWVSRYSDLFSNAQLTQGDNARLFSNLVSDALGPGGAVLFDDMHQGLSDIYDPQAFFSDPRLHATLLFLVAFWFIYVAGASQRLAAPRQQLRPYSGRELVQAVGGLMARRLSNYAVVSELYRHFFNDVRHRYGLPTNGEPVWTLLDGHHGMDRAELKRTAALYEALARNRVPAPVEVARRLHHLRERLQ